MKSDWTRVRAVLEGALDLDAEQRAAFLTEQCGTDEDLRQQVEQLLAADRTPGEIAIEQPVTATLPETVQQIGAYQIRGVLGSGGMSTVFEAQQEKPRRTVALKTIHFGVLSSELLRRLAHESEVLGQLRHPAIAQIYEAGTWLEPITGQEVPFFAMEFVDGALPFDEYIIEHGVALRPALELFLIVCDAVQHGHQLGVIHRDLKPANALVDDSGQPKVIDFGIARATDVEASGARTRAGQVLGTLPYMAPEQFDGQPDAIDIRVDVYALGVMLYQVLAGGLPFELGDRSVTGFAQHVREHRPAPPSDSARGFGPLGVAKDLDWITDTAMAADKRERYASVSELAADLRRHLANQPVSVGQPSGIYQLRKFIARNRRLVAGACALLVVLILGVIGTTWQMLRAQNALVAADLEKARANTAAATAGRQAMKADRVNEFLNQLLLFADASDGRFVTKSDMTVREALDAVAGRLDELEEEPDIEADVRLSLSSSYRSLGFYEQAERHVRECLALRRSHFGSQHPDVAEALVELAGVQSHREKRAEAMELYRQALAINLAAYGAEHAEVALCRVNIGDAFLNANRLDKAESELARAIEIYQGLEGDFERFVASALPKLALIAARRGDRPRSIALYREAIAAFERAGKSQHPYAADARESLAWSLHLTGDEAAAETLLREALAINTRAYGAGFESGATHPLQAGDDSAECVQVPGRARTFAGRRAILRHSHG